MKKSKIFMTTGALFLAVTAIFATKANKKFNSVSEAFVMTGVTSPGTNTGYIIKNGTAFAMTTVAAGKHQLTFYVDGSAVVGGLYTGTSISDKKIFQ